MDSFQFCTSNPKFLDGTHEEMCKSLITIVVKLQLQQPLCNGFMWTFAHKYRSQQGDLIGIEEVLISIVKAYLCTVLI